MKKQVMMMLTFSMTILFFSIPTAAFFRNPYPRILKSQSAKSGDDPGVPLLLTPLIEQGKIDDAQMASEVYFDGFLNKISYAGLFAENGPFSVKIQHGLKERIFAWTKTHSVIYIDNPVGTGYSFTNGGYAQNETKVGEDLYQALIQFFTMFSNLQSNDFYVSGESYGGKYVPAIAYTIHQKNPTANLKINLKGLTIGNGYSDPINQLEYGDYLYQIGLYDSNTRDQIKKLEQQGIDMIKNKQWERAARFFDTLMDGDMNNSSFFKNVTGFKNYFNYIYPNDPIEFEIKLMGKYIQRNDVRAAIHVGNVTFHEDNLVEEHLIEDSVQSVAPWISELLNNYRVLIYNGQLDIICAYSLTINYLQKLNFNGAEAYKTAVRYQWKVGDDIAGYVKVAGNLTEILVRDAGHMVPNDQAQWAFDMINRFTNNKPFY